MCIYMCIIICMGVAGEKRWLGGGLPSSGYAAWLCVA